MDDLPAAARYAIVGGGFAGLATAWALADAGVDGVVVLERDSRLCGHASSHNAAMCRALAEDDAWTALTAAGAAWLRSPPPGFTSRPLVDDRGAVLLTHAPAPLATAAARHAIRCAPITAAEITARWPGLDVDRGGLWFPDDGCVDLDALTAGFVAGARRRGVRCVVDAGVTAIAHDGRAVLTTTKGVVRADVVVAAGGAWSGLLGALVGAATDFAPKKRHLFALRLDLGAAPIVWNVDADEWYVRPDGGGVLASACDHTASAPGEVEVDDAVRATLRARLPAALRGLTIDRAWACQRTYAGGGPPRIGWDPQVPWWCWVAGLGGHGVTASAAVGLRAAAVLRGPR